MEVLVEIPAGVGPGDEMLVQADEQEFVVVVPPGVCAGSMLEVTIPAADPPATGSSPRFVEISVPPGRLPGDELIVEVAGSPMSVLVPDWATAGAIVRVEVPPPARSSSSAGGELVATFGGDMKEDACIAAYGARVQSGLPPPALHHPYPVDQPSAPAAPAAAAASTPAAAAPLAVRPGKFWVGLEVEVLRSSGTRTLGHIEATDELSATYTVRTHDGRLKYMVEEADLEHLYAGMYRTGEEVTVRRGQRERDARIAGHDDDSGTYSVIFDDGQIVEQIKRMSIRRPSSEMG